ncbi:hypothetical protein ETD83_18795 [Actinomadura soli]|uniref:Uncharacterized protein n=1 Tax=Actinomadura soli TaxID=2508997 RepID=A0A5C4JC28_9ACTN|nr:hypothetical protein ETD83_18795 [Actinomadura soli]
MTNLVSGGVTLKGWQWPAMWAVFGALILVAVVLDVRRSGESEDDASGAVAAFAEVRRTYLERLRERYRRVDLEILLPSDQSEHPPMLLGEVFVPQLVRDDPPPRELLDLPREVQLRLVDSGELPELPEGDGPGPVGAGAARLSRTARAAGAGGAGGRGRRSGGAGRSGGGQVVPGALSDAGAGGRGTGGR